MATTTMVKSICISVVFVISSLLTLAQLRTAFTAIPVSGCAPLVVTFLDQSTGSPTQWRWDLGNGTISFLQNPSVTYFNPGQYNVKLVIQNASGRDSLVKNQYITIYAQPTVNFSASLVTGCFPLPVQFTDMSVPGSGTIDSWQWDFGDGTSSTLQNPSHTYTAGGNYNVSLRVRNTQGCYKTLTRTQYIQINTGVIANFSNSAPSSCTAPVNINFQNLSTGTGVLSYQWDFGDGGTSTLPNPSHSYMAQGSFTIRLIVVSAFGCRDTLIKNNGITIGTVRADFNPPATACVNAGISFVNTSTPLPASVLWRFGDGTTSTSLNPTKIYSMPGTYQVRLISNFGACLDSITKTITVLPKPVAGFSAPLTMSCSQPFTVNFSNTSTGGTSYTWLFGDGSSSTSANPVHTYTATGNYTVTLISNGANGCADTLVRTDYVKIQLPQVTINDQVGGCAPFSWTFIATVNSVEPVTQYEWDFGDGTTSTEVSPTHIFANGVYNIKLKITTASGCTVTRIDTSAISAGVKPDANFSATPRTVCAKYIVYFSDLSTGNVDRWLWDFGDGGISEDQNPTHIYEDTGYFNVSLVVWNLGCKDTIQFPDYIYIDPPIAAFTTELLCGGSLTLNFTDRSIGADTWLWDFGDGTTSTLQNPTHTYADSGLYFVKLTVFNNRTGCDFTKTHEIAIYGIAAGFTASDTTICKRSMVQFDATGLNPNIISYKWDFGDGTSDSSISVSHTYNTSGVYDVRLIITDSRGCSDTLVKPRYIRVDGPAAAFDASLPGSCSMSAITFTDNSTGDGIHPIIKWVWDYGDGVIDTLLSAPFSHTYMNPGIYTVKLMVIDDNNCSDTSSRVNLVTISAPDANFMSPDTIACPNRPIRFINTSVGLPGLSYTWHFGDGNTSTLKDPIHQYAADGSYTILLIARDVSGCIDSMSKSSFVQVTTPISNFTVSDSVGTCPPLVVDFTNASSSYTSILWDFGDGTSAQTLNPSHFYSIPGTYMAKLTAFGPGGCTAVKQIPIVLRGPQGSFTYGGLNDCTPFTVNFTASTQDRVSFIWDFDDGSTVVGNDSILSHTYTIPGFYIPKMILRDAGGCVVPIIGVDTIRVRGVVASFDFNTQVICNAATLQFTNTSATNDIIASYHWDFGDGTTSNLPNPSHLYNRAGLYYPSLRITTITGCSDTVISAAPVKIVTAPQASLVQTPNGCTPLAVTFSGRLDVPDTSAVTWRWNFGNGDTSVLQNPQPTNYSTGGNYNITLVATNSSGCTDTVTTTVQAFTTPVITASSDTVICRGNSVAISAAGAPSMSWFPSTGLSCVNCASPVASPSTRTRYTATGTTAEGCSNTDTIVVDLRHPFTMLTGNQDSVCVGESAGLSAAGAVSYRWSPATGLDNSNIANPVATPVVSTTYRVIGTDDRNCFSDTSYVPVTVFPIPTVEAGSDRTINIGQTIDLLPELSPDVTNVVWSPTGSVFRFNYPAATVKPRETTTYKVEVRNSGGCISTDNVTVHVLCDGTNYFIPNTFSPNGDGANDIFYPRGTGLYLIKTARVFNRWGEVVYERNDFIANDAGSGWDGTHKGKKLSPDVYVYVIEILCDNNALLPLKGNVMLIR